MRPLDACITLVLKELLLCRLSRYFVFAEQAERVLSGIVS